MFNIKSNKKDAFFVYSFSENGYCIATKSKKGRTFTINMHAANTSELIARNGFVTSRRFSLYDTCDFVSGNNHYFVMGDILVFHRVDDVDIRLVNMDISEERCISVATITIDNIRYAIIKLRYSVIVINLSVDVEVAAKM
jgi:hypothetical protein